MNNVLFDLCTLSGLRDDESTAVDYCVDYLEKYTDDVTVDFNNNVRAFFEGKDCEKTILLDAHIDKIGFIVTEVDDKGFIKVDKVGGVDLRTVLDAPVLIHGRRNLFGVVCCMPPHLSDGNEDKAPSIDSIVIQPEGIADENIRSIVSTGDSISFCNDYNILLKNRISAAALDNRAGVAALLEVAENISDLELNADVIISLTTQEETYAAGAKTTSFRDNPDECICVDMSFASQPGVSGQYASVKLGKGPMLCVSPNLDREMFNRLKNICEEKDIPFQTEVCGGRTGTNADHIAVSKSGVKTALISIPEKNMHTRNEIVQLSDISATAELIVEYLRRC